MPFSVSAMKIMLFTIRAGHFSEKENVIGCLIDGAQRGEKECHPLGYLPKMEVHH